MDEIIKSHNQRQTIAEKMTCLKKSNLRIIKLINDRHRINPRIPMRQETNPTYTNNDTECPRKRPQNTKFTKVKFDGQA